MRLSSTLSLLGVLVTFHSLLTNANIENPNPIHLLTADTKNAYPNPIHILRPQSGSMGHKIPGINCLSWRLAVETNNFQNWKTVPESCEGYVGNYMMGAQYRKDCFAVAAAAYDYVKGLSLNKDGKDIWIFDIDETSLSNMPYYARPSVAFGAHPYNATAFDEWQAEAKAPAIPAVLSFYNNLIKLGVKVVFLSGTAEKLREPKTRNMRNIGYNKWEMMILKQSNESHLKAVEYKSMHRAKLEKMGYRIIGNIGDQWSDLLGTNTGMRTFKVPDPMYYIS